jgi:hypothetical protein
MPGANKAGHHAIEYMGYFHRRFAVS